MSKYLELRNSKPTLKVVKNPKEVIVSTISCMCDNTGTLKLKKNSGGEFKMNGCGFALSNWQFKHDKYDIEWAADENRWDAVFDMINTGTAVIERISSR